MREKEKEKINEAEITAHGLIQMYQAGFLDGFKLYIKRKRRKIINPKNIFPEISEACKKAFEFRFVRKMQGKIKLENVGNV